MNREKRPLRPTHDRGQELRGHGIRRSHQAVIAGILLTVIILAGALACLQRGGRFVTIYLPAASGEGLLAYKVRLPYWGSVNSHIGKLLVDPPRGLDYVHLLPEGTRLLSLRVTQGTAFVDFSAELATRQVGGSLGERLMVYAIVNTLADLPSVHQVRFLIEGEPVEVWLGHLDLSVPLRPVPKLLIGQ